MKSPQRHLNQRRAMVDALHLAGRIVLVVLAIAAALILASSALTAAMALPDTLAQPPRW